MQRIKARISLLIPLVLALLAVAKGADGDGLMIPAAAEYPKDFLKHRLTQVEIRINGLVVETSVYQEFVNEWDQATDAVYSFPLPAAARATNFVYWHEDQAYKAVVEEQEQVINPGTGEGGPAAGVNRFIDTNGLRISLKDIGPGQTQKVRLDYISFCSYWQGTCTYTYPLDSGGFTTYPLEQLQFDLQIASSSDILAFDCPSHENFRLLKNEPRAVAIEMIDPKGFIDRDFTFEYQVDDSRLGVDFYSADNDSTEGHFALFVRPQGSVSTDSVLPKRIIFLLSNSSRMFGTKLDQGVRAIGQALDLLGPQDFFNIVLFNNSVESWRDSPVAATAEQIQRAKEYLSTIETSFGSRLDHGLERSLQQITDDGLSNSILVFSVGRSPVDPLAVEAQNQFRTGIFPVAFGADVDRARLEMLAGQNYGFVTYLAEDSNLAEGMLRVFRQISQPLLANTAIEFSRGDISAVLPEKVPTTYAGSAFFTTGRYQQSGASSFKLSGLSPEGILSYDADLDFNSSTAGFNFAGQIWAKEKIDDLERRIAVSGEDEDLRRQVVELSLDYNLRSRFTAFVADYETVFVPEFDALLNEPLATQSIEVAATAVTAAALDSDGPPYSLLLDNYPNPFNASTVLRLYIHPAAARVKLLKIYNSLGQLVQAVDISDLAAGWHQVPLLGRDAFGRSLASGIYFVHLQVANQVVAALRITLVK